jgi:hypothetical protein
MANQNYTDISALKQYTQQINAHFGGEVVQVHPPRNTFNLRSITGKIAGGKEAIELVMQKVFGKKVTVAQLSGDVATAVSGKYDSFLVTLPNSGFYFRSVIGSTGTLHEKDLTPSKLKIIGKKLTKATFDHEVELGLLNLSNDSDISLEILELLHELLLVVSIKGDSINLTDSIKKLIATISPKDIKVVGKNFGEILLAKWCLYNKPKAVSVEFPQEENAPLVDFTVNLSNKETLNVSAKFEQGANVSIISIIPKDAVAPIGSTAEEKKAFSAIVAIVNEPILQGLISAEKILNTPEYKAIEKMCKGNTVNIKNISDVVESALLSSGIPPKSNVSTITKQKVDTFRKIMDPFYSKISGGFPSKLDSFAKIAHNNSGGMADPVLYAFSVALAKRFNEDSIFSDILNKAAKSIDVEQIYLNFTSSQITVKVKVFSESKFLFAAGAMAHSADNVRMKVQMIKK